MPDPIDLELSLHGGVTDLAVELRVRRGDDVELRYGPYPLSIAILSYREVGSFLKLKRTHLIAEISEEVMYLVEGDE